MRIGKHKIIINSPIVIKFQSPVSVYNVFQKAATPIGWKRRMKRAAKEGRVLEAIREIKFGTGLGLREAKELWDNKYKKKYYKPHNYEPQC